ncbi:hypothetical protein GCM10010349_07680 [Streptomyces flavofungini]|nr:hypothetical protein GCM10010349_07680 [Streptomyces flavofungini]
MTSPLRGSVQCPAVMVVIALLCSLTVIGLAVVAVLGMDFFVNLVEALSG